MKLFLTSNGLCNDSISKAFFELVGKEAGDTVVTCIPTASNLVEDGKEWYVRNLACTLDLGIKKLNIADISAIPEKYWLPQFEEADVLLFSGGDTLHLMNQIKKSGLEQKLPGLLESRVFVGISAGSIVAGESIIFSSITDQDREEYEKLYKYRSDDALELINIHIRPHFNNPLFPLAKKEAVEQKAKTVSEPVYAIDDNTAIKVDGDDIEVISEGEYHIFNE